MTVPLIIKVSAWSPAAPLVAGLVARPRWTPPRRTIVVVAALGMLTTAAQIVLAHLFGNNLWLIYVSAPVESVLVWWALSYWQTSRLARQALRIAIPVALVLHVVIVLFLEDVRSFSTVSTPMFGAFGLAACLYTVVTRAVDETDALWRQDWFWIGGGFALYFGVLAVLQPMAFLLIGERQDLVRRAWELFAVTHVLANLAIAAGMLCPISARSTISGDSLPRSRSASASQSPPSSAR